MKLILPSVLLTMCSITTFAVPLCKKQNTQHVAIYSAILQKQAIPSSASKTTGLQKRIIANSYVTNGTLTDTNHYYYSNGRGSTHSSVESYYDEYYMTAIEPVHNILCDSSTNSHLYSGQWYKTGTRSYTYDANNRITKMLSRSYSTITSFIPSYNTTGKMDTITMADTMAPVPAVAPKTKMHIIYDVLNRRIKDQNNKIDGSLYTKREYTYDANGNRVRFDSYQYIAGNWELTYRNQNSYDAGNRLIISTAEIDFGSGNGLEKSNKDSFAYTGSNTQPSYHKNFNWDAGQGDWVADEIIVRQYNAANLVDTYYIIRYTAQWDTIERDVYTYDTDKLLLRSNGYMYTGNGTFSATPYDQSTMYYESHYPTSVANNTLSTNINIYPNPANEVIHIQAPGIDNYTASVANMQGQVLYRSTHKGNIAQTISIKHLAPGNYILNIFNSDGASIAQKQFIRE